MPDSEAKYDYLGFFRALDAVRETREKNWKEVANETGVSASTLTRLSQGRGLDGRALAGLAAWAGIDPREFSEVRKAETESLALLTSFIAKDRRLSPNSKAAFEEIVRVAYRNLVEKEATDSKKS